MTSQYLTRYGEPEARRYLRPAGNRGFQHCLVIPAYREAVTLAAKLSALLRAHPDLLVILVLNHPTTDGSDDPNAALRNALENTERLLVLERPDPLPAREAVGLARKIGCDTACALMRSGQLRPGWIHCTDADASLPDRYFVQADTLTASAGAIAHPFQHSLCGAHGRAMTLYELRLHHYVLGLREAGSPYAFHTLGSSLSIRNDIYEKVRGFPRRAAGEDFYLLNKAAKVAPVATPATAPVTIEARLSDRVPFGTGPALAKLAASARAESEPLFYHPASFSALGTALALIERRADLRTGLRGHRHAHSVLRALGLEKALRHCHRHGRDPAAFRRHFQQWLDGFRTLKFIHGMRDAGYEDQSFTALSKGEDPVELLRRYRGRLGWDTGLGLEQEPANIRQRGGELHHEAAPVTAVDDPVIVGE